MLTLVELSLERPASIDELSEAMGLYPEEYLFILEELCPVPLFGLSSPCSDEKNVPVELLVLLAVEDLEQTPWNRVIAEYFAQQLIQGIDSLMGRERLVISLYYYQGLDLKEISTFLALSENSVCQLHSQGMIRLRANMRQAWRALGAATS